MSIGWDVNFLPSMTVSRIIACVIGAPSCPSYPTSGHVLSNGTTVIPKNCANFIANDMLMNK